MNNGLWSHCTGININIIVAHWIQLVGNPFSRGAFKETQNVIPVVFKGIKPDW